MRLLAVGVGMAALMTVGVVPANAVPELGTHAALADFDGDGISDLSLVRADGAWSIWPSALTCCWGFSWGHMLSRESVPVPGDYDGNLSTDPAVFLPDDGLWQIMPSNGTGAYIVSFGQSGDIPVPGDYDGDGRTEPAVYRPTDGRWYLRSGEVATDLTLGQPDDVPAPADYDGDGRTDAAMFRPSTASWIIRHSTDGTESSEQFGLAGDTLVPADYDGDGRTDLAVFRPSTADWHIRHSSDGSVETVQWGRRGDLVAPADYDGDGRVNIAVYHPATSHWLIRDAGTRVQFGGPNDIPVAGTYLPRPGLP